MKTERDQEMGNDRRIADERAEGVISTAIAVLIVALLGVILWAGFRTIVTDATEKTRDQVDQIDSTP